MQYLIRKKKPKCHHVFVDGDTLCRLYSTGGMKKKKYRVAESPEGLTICTMCGNVLKLTTGDEAKAKIEKAAISERKKELARLIQAQRLDMKRGYNGLHR